MVELLPIPGWPRYYVCEKFVWFKAVGEWPVKIDGHVQPKGHILVTLNKKEDGYRIKKNWLVHRLIALVWLGPPPPNKPLVLHWDNNPANNHYTNLRYGDYFDNNHQMINDGHMGLGEQRPNSKLTEDAVFNILQRLDAGERHESITKEYGINRRQIGEILNGRTWRHVTGFERR